MLTWASVCRGDVFLVYAKLALWYNQKHNKEPRLSVESSPSYDTISSLNLLRSKSSLFALIRKNGNIFLEALRKIGTYNFTLETAERELLEQVHHKIRNTPELHQPNNKDRETLNLIGHQLEVGWRINEIRRFLGRKASMIDLLMSEAAENVTHPPNTMTP